MTTQPHMSDLNLVLLLLFIAMPFGVAVYMFWLAWTRGGDPCQDAVSVQYESPDNLTPAECGTLVDNAVALHSITATMTDLSVRGYLTIEQKETIGEKGSHTDYVFHLAKPLSELGTLKPHESEVMTSLFMPANPLLLMAKAFEGLQHAHVASGNKTLDSIGNEMLASRLASASRKAREASDQYLATAGATGAAMESVALSDLQQAQFAMRLRPIRDAIFNRLVTEGYYATRPDMIRILYTAKGVLLGLLMAVAGGRLAWATKMQPMPLIGIGLLTGAIVVGFGLFLPARTSAGAKTLAKVLGFREFLSRVEKDHIERLEKTPELFEKYLPYAMALRVENKWTQTFGGITVPPPQWYRSKPRDGFLPIHLTNDLNHMSNQAGNALAPALRAAGLAADSVVNLRTARP